MQLTYASLRFLMHTAALVCQVSTVVVRARRGHAAAAKICIFMFPRISGKRPTRKKVTYQTLPLCEMGVLQDYPALACMQED